MFKTLDKEKVVARVSQWLESFVIELNLCPFAKKEFKQNKIRFVVSDADTEEKLLLDLSDELEFLQSNENTETSLLIHPSVLQEFGRYNQFLDYADQLLRELNMEGDFQIASFHPDYQFANTEQDDIENFTNRSPYPLLHLLREDSVERAVANYENAEMIPDNNIALMQELGKLALMDMFEK
jgi:uncharacterized protein